MQKINIFIIICVAIAEVKTNNKLNLELLQKLLEYKDIFFNEAVGTLILFKEGNYIINIEEGKMPLYGLLYNLL